MADRPGVSQSYGGTGFAANEAEIYQMGDLGGQLGFAPIGNDGLVYMGADYDEPPQRKTFVTPEHLAGDRRTSETVIPGRETGNFTLEQAELEYYRLDAAQKARWDAATTGALGYEPSPVYKQSLWRDAITYVANYQKATGEKLDPFTYMESLAEQGGGRGRGGGAYMGPVTTKSRSKDVNLTNPSEARAFLDNALGEYLGRRPTTDEYENFTKALNIQERGAPVITESETTVTPQGDALRTQEGESIRKGGFTPGQFAKEFARGQEGAAKAAVGGPLLNAFLGLLRGE